MSNKELIARLEQSGRPGPLEKEAAQALRSADEKEQLYKNCKGAVVIAKEWIAEKDAEIEKLQARINTLEEWLDNEREACLFWQAKARTHSDAKQALQDKDGHGRPF